MTPTKPLGDAVPGTPARLEDASRRAIHDNRDHLNALAAFTPGSLEDLFKRGDTFELNQAARERIESAAALGDPLAHVALECVDRLDRLDQSTRTHLLAAFGPIRTSVTIKGRTSIATTLFRWLSRHDPWAALRAKPNDQQRAWITQMVQIIRPLFHLKQDGDAFATAQASFIQAFKNFTTHEQRAVMWVMAWVAVDVCDPAEIRSQIDTPAERLPRVVPRKARAVIIAACQNAGFDVLFRTQGKALVLESPTEARPLGTLLPTELAAALRGGVLAFVTSASGKQRKLIAALAGIPSSDGARCGINADLVHGSAVGILPLHSPEEEGSITGNGAEKATIIREHSDTRGDVARRMLSSENSFRPQDVAIVSISNDEEFVVLTNSPKQQAQFIDAVFESFGFTADGEPISGRCLLKPDSYWLLKGIREDGFPGANLRPLAESLVGGFDTLIRIIHRAADAAGLEAIRYRFGMDVSFTHGDKVMNMTSSGDGELMGEDEYASRLAKLGAGEFLGLDDIQFPDRAEGLPRWSLRQWIQDGVFGRRMESQWVDIAQRKFAEAMMDLVGPRETPSTRTINVGVLRPGGHEDALPLVEGTREVAAASHSDLLQHPGMNPWGDAEVLVLQPSSVAAGPDAHGVDPNISRFTDALVDLLVTPSAVRMPLIVDARDGRADRLLRYWTEASKTGRLASDLIPAIARTDAELQMALEAARDYGRAQPKIEAPPSSDPVALPVAPKVDGIPALMISAGHANNSSRDTSEGYRVGMWAAQQGIRLIGGGGVRDGSMGSFGTGWLAHHLQRIDTASASHLPEDLLRDLMVYSTDRDRLVFDRRAVERLAIDGWDVVERLTELGNNPVTDRPYIPRDMFYATSTQPLLDMESPSRKSIPGGQYVDAGNLPRRLVNLGKPPVQLSLAGGVGTDQEILHWLAAADKKPLVIYDPHAQVGPLLEYAMLSGPIRSGESVNGHPVFVFDTLDAALAKVAELVFSCT